MIYFIRAGSSVKIGVVTNRPLLQDRLRSLQCGSSLVLNVVGVMDGNREVEQELHSRFNVDRYLGEWFRLSYNIIEFIETHCRPFITQADQSNLVQPLPKADSESLKMVLPIKEPNNKYPGQDTLIQDFIRDCVRPGVKCKASVLYNAFESYCREKGQNYTVPAMRCLSLQLIASGFTRFRISTVYYRVSIIQPADCRACGDLLAIQNAAALT